MPDVISEDPSWWVEEYVRRLQAAVDAAGGGPIPCGKDILAGVVADDMAAARAALVAGAPLAAPAPAPPPRKYGKCGYENHARDCECGGAGGSR